MGFQGQVPGATGFEGLCRLTVVANTAPMPQLSPPPDSHENPTPNATERPARQTKPFVPTTRGNTPPSSPSERPPRAVAPLLRTSLPAPTQI